VVPEEFQKSVMSLAHESSMTEQWSLLTYLIVGLSTGPSLIHLWFQDRMLSPHLYLDIIVVPGLLTNDAYRHRYATSDL
jgi:hypothetical protein